MESSLLACIYSFILRRFLCWRWRQLRVMCVWPQEGGSVQRNWGADSWLLLPDLPSALGWLSRLLSKDRKTRPSRSSSLDGSYSKYLLLSCVQIIFPLFFLQVLPTHRRMVTIYIKEKTEYVHALFRYVLFLVGGPKGNPYSDLHPYRLILAHCWSSCGTESAYALCCVGFFC